MAQVYFIDGQQLDPSYFGYTDALTNTWRPKKAKITLGSVWSNYFTDIGIIDDGALTNVFDGNTATQFEFNSTGGNGVFRPPNPIPYSTSVELFSSRAFGGNTVSVNGGSTVSYGGNAWVTVASGPGTLTSLTFYNGTAGNQRIHAIRIDGNILTNTSGAIDAGANGYYLPLDGNSPIGQDQSGRGNNWTPVNFGGSNTIEKATGALPILNTDGGGKVARVGVRTDSNASSLVLALPLVGIKSDFSNAINSGTSNKAITANGNAAASSAQSNFYGGSFYFDGTGDYVYPAQSSDFSFGTGDFTIECWGYATSISNTLNTFFDTRKVSDSTVGFGVFLNSSGQWRVDAGTGSGISAGNAGTGIANKWYHVALVRDSGTVKLFVDGNLNGSVSNTTNLTSQDITIGYNYDRSTWSFTGYIQDVRVYKGVAKYTSNFIPASTDPDILPDTPSGVAYSSNVALVPSTDGAVAFDGSDYLGIPYSSNFVLDGDFTIEYFVYWQGGQVMLDFSRSASYTNAWQLYNQTPVFYGYSSGGNAYMVSSTALTSNAWNHIAVTRTISNNTARMFINGVQTASSTDFSQTYGNDTGNSLYVGSQVYSGPTAYFTGMISNLHIVKGTALYTSNFTPPTAPITSVANTKLLCCKSQTSARDFSNVPGNSVIYSDYATGNNASNDVRNVFNTNTSDTIGVYTTRSFVFTPPTPISYSSSIKVQVNTGDGSPMAFNVNGAGFGSYNLYNGVQEVTVVSGSGTLSSLAIAVNAGGGADFYYIKVDGNILYDPISVLGNAAPTNFNPFNSNINTQRKQSTVYATLNPLDTANTLSNNNLTLKNGSTGFKASRATIGITTGKWYCECTITAIASRTNTSPGLWAGGSVLSTGGGYYGNGSIVLLEYPAGTLNVYTNYGGTVAYSESNTLPAGSVVGMCFDASNGKFWYSKNGVYLNGGNPSAGTGAVVTGIAATTTYFFGGHAYSASDQLDFNFGQKPFQFLPPAGFQPLALANTPRPTIVRPDQYVGIITYTGTTANPVSIKSTNFTFTPDFVWVKSRSNGESHALYDTVRGATYRLRSDTTNPQSTGANELQSFISGGFTAGNNGHIYYDGYTYVAWCWKAGGNSNTYNINDVGYATTTAAGLTAGTIAPTGISVNTKSGFSIIKYTGTGANATVPHGLGNAPSFMMFKQYTATGGTSGVTNWRYYHTSLGNTKAFYVPANTISTSSSHWNNTSPTSTVFTIGTDDGVNDPGSGFICYAWTEIPGFSKFSSYTGNGSTDGPAVITGFRPRFIMIKSTGSDDRWTIQDTSRDSYNPSINTLSPNLSNVELTTGFDLDITSNGFKIRNTNSGHNTLSGTYIYAAFAETPSFNLYGGQANAR